MEVWWFRRRRSRNPAGPACFSPGEEAWDKCTSMCTTKCTSMCTSLIRNHLPLRPYSTYVDEQKQHYSRSSTSPEWRASSKLISRDRNTQHAPERASQRYLAQHVLKVVLQKSTPQQIRSELPNKSKLLLLLLSKISWGI